jgi:hypothetical protein
VGYQCVFLCTKPAPAQRQEFSQPHFDEQVQRWRKISEQDEALLVEDSPWAYFQRHVQHLPADVRNAAQATLATLTLPHLTIVL